MFLPFGRECWTLSEAEARVLACAGDRCHAGAETGAYLTREPPNLSTRNFGLIPGVGQRGGIEAREGAALMPSPIMATPDLRFAICGLRFCRSRMTDALSAGFTSAWTVLIPTCCAIDSAAVRLSPVRRTVRRPISWRAAMAGAESG